MAHDWVYVDEACMCRRCRIGWKSFSPKIDFTWALVLLDLSAQQQFTTSRIAPSQWNLDSRGRASCDKFSSDWNTTAASWFLLLPPCGSRNPIASVHGSGFASADSIRTPPWTDARRRVAYCRARKENTETFGGGGACMICTASRAAARYLYI